MGNEREFDLSPIPNPLTQLFNALIKRCKLLKTLGFLAGTASAPAVCGCPFMRIKSISSPEGFLGKLAIFAQLPSFSTQISQSPG